jgi:DNA-directed RNA polymerase specialized sigma24 family protein
MFQSTTAENFQSWDRFLDAYYAPIRTALRLLPFVGEGRADDFAQSFFLKIYERNILENRPPVKGRFRNWLYVAARRHAIDEWRKLERRPEQLNTFETFEPAEPHAAPAEDITLDPDELYALSIVHMTVERVRKHLIAEGKSEHWRIFDELVLAPLFPDRLPKTRDELLALFPGQGPGFLDNRLTTVKRVFRRILPVLVPADPTDHLTSVERFDELVEILRRSNHNRLWLAFLTQPRPGPEDPPDSSVDLAARSSAGSLPGTSVSVESPHDELRVLLGFWLDMPLTEYLDEIVRVGPAVALAIRDSRPLSSTGRPRNPRVPLSLKTLLDGGNPAVAAIPAEELIILLERIKEFAKRVHRTVKQEKDKKTGGQGLRESSMPVEIAQVMYNLAAAVALNRCGKRIIGIGDDRYRKNVAWVLNQSWLDSRLRPVFSLAMQQLDLPRS